MVGQVEGLRAGTARLDGKADRPDGDIGIVERGHGAAPEAARARPRRILCVTPLGLDGRGGIDRLYRYVRELPSDNPDLDIRYAVSRGTSRGPLWVPAFAWHFAWIAATLVGWRPDLIHINYANGGSLLRKVPIAALARLLGVPVVMHLHCVFPVAAAERKRPAGRAALWLARGAARVIAIGRCAERDFLDTAHLPRRKVEVIANGAPDIGRGLPLPKRHSSVRIAFAGELGSRKGPTFLIEALAELRDEPNWHCTIAGNGDVEGCRRLIHAFGLANRVTITGWLPAEATHELMRQADIVVLPSAREVMPMSLIEAASAGAVLLATPVGEVREVVSDGENGFLIARDPGNIAARLRQLIQDPALLARMQLASRAIYDRRFRLEDFAHRLRTLYAAVAAEVSR